MADKNSLDKIKEKKKEWETTTLGESIKNTPEKKERFTNLSQKVIERIYTSLEGDIDYLNDLGFPGEYPYTRGIYPTMYRAHPWTVREFAGFGTAEETNERLKYLLKQGETGLSIAFDLPTLLGRDSDDPLSEGEVGRCGVAIDTLVDMETLFRDIPLDKVTTSMTINAPASVLFAMYIALAENQGIDPVKLEGTIQNDILKEYIAQNEWIYPPESSLRLITDTIVYSARYIPKWHPLSISGYHIREAGSTAIQELAFTLYDGLTYVDEVIKAGLNIDEFAPRLSFFFNSHNDFFEEIAKFRAARRIWAREIKKRYNPGDPHSMALRFHTQTAGCTLTAQQPLNNIIRVTIQALAGVLGGTQSLHTDSLDETLALPSEEAVMIALRTQQIIAEESGVTNTIDPLGGSYYIEALTNEMEKGAHEYFKKLDDLGGMVSAIEKSFPQNEIREASYTYQKEIDNNERMIVGVNKFTTKEEQPIETLKIKPEIEKKQVEKLQAFKKNRDNNRLNKALEELKKTAESGKSIMPMIIKAVKLYATVGDVCNAMKEVFGEYKEPGTI
ncbi:MAG: acyl-CoA mutase large subunit family protein [Candidatus Scalindua sp.]